jgi:hypothetical protein
MGWPGCSRMLAYPFPTTGEAQRDGANPCAAEDAERKGALAAQWGQPGTRALLRQVAQVLPEQRCVLDKGWQQGTSMSAVQAATLERSSRASGVSQLAIQAAEHSPLASEQSGREQATALAEQPVCPAKRAQPYG